MAERKPVNPWLIFILICIPIFIGSVDLTSIVVVLPQATLDLLGPKGLNKADQALWAVTAYLLAYTLSLALVGRLSDVLPRKRIFLACIAIFIAGSLWAGLATELPLTILKAFPIWPDPDVLPLISLVIGRIIQATGAGASVSVGMALVSDVFPPDKRAEPISLIGALDSLGWVVGNLYAGVMLQILPSWRGLFLINAGVALAALVFSVILLRGATLGKGVGRFDWRGALVFATALIALTVGIESLSNPSLGLSLLVGSVIFTALFIFLQLRTRDALFDMRFIRQPEVRAALLTNLIVGFGLILMVAGVPLVINLRAVFLRGEGLLTGALRAGVTLCALTVPLIVAVLVGESRYRRIGAAIPVAMGLLLGIIGFLGASLLWQYTAPSYVIALPLALVGVGLGLTIGPLSLVVVDAAEASARGLASSLVLMMRLLGMTFGTPLAAALTLKLANDWASARVADMGTLRDIARSMLIPPMATEALAHVMLAGVITCALGLVVFYLPRTFRKIRTGIAPRSLLQGGVSLAVIVVLVTGFAVADSYSTPTILPNPIAQQLPPNVTFYAALNIQQLFLENTRRPLDAVMNLLNTVGASSIPSNAPDVQSSESPIDNVIKSLFRARTWTAESYRAFCVDPGVPPDQWQSCFTASLLSWIGPQAAFALLPRTRADHDYLFAFQATNRNNAIQFATNLAAALDAREPLEAGPNIRILTINAGSSDEHRLAITEAYMLVGTPRAVQYTLNHGNLSLADQPDYQAITRQLPSADFATFYMRSGNFETDLKPALNSVFQSPLIDAITRLINPALSVAFTRTGITPTLVGLSLRVDERQLMLDMVANFPFSLQKLNAAPVPGTMLGFTPASAKMWAAANLNIAGLAREVNITDTLAAFSANQPDLRALLANPLAQNIVGGFGRSIQHMLTFARGQIMVMAVPGADPARPAPNYAVILPLADKETVKAGSAIAAIKTQLQLLGGLSGGLTMDTQTGADSSEIVTVRGQALEAALPGGFQFMLTGDNLLVLATGGSLQTILDTLKAGGQPAAVQQIAVSLPGPLDRFLYAYVDPSTPAQAIDLTALFGAKITPEGFYLSIVLRTK
ncbi:MAG: MFS transporter [Anaerolineae bacterium]|nr:MFS transporter [Anaerolineae bacterium]